jgi:hypothetical protein
MVVTQAAHGHALPVSLQFPSDIAVLTAVVGLQRETTVSPQLANSLMAALHCESQTLRLSTQILATL